MSPPPGSYLSKLECPECGQFFDPDELQTFCLPCNSPLLARYDLAAIKRQVSLGEITLRLKGLWRWAELLPVRNPAFRLTLGEGDTPLLAAPRLSQELGLQNVFIKEESLNPTGTFKARGMAVAVSRALELGVEVFVVPTAGNAGGAMAAYVARCGRSAQVFMPKDAPALNRIETKCYGAILHLVDGQIDEAGRHAAENSREYGWFDLSTFKEPYRVEGKKTMGFELAEQLDWELPDVIIYPTGGGTGLVGMWKAFGELQALGWISQKRPRMVCVQAEGCAPVVRAFGQGKIRCEPWEEAHTIAAGLRVPRMFADRLVLRALYDSQGVALSVSDEEILGAQSEFATLAGIFPAPEGAATLAGLKRLLDRGWIKSGEKVILFNTGTGLKYPHRN